MSLDAAFGEMRIPGAAREIGKMKLNSVSAGKAGALGN
jgi:hypothetical protein